MLDKTIKELWDLGVSTHFVFQESPYYIALRIEKDGKIYQKIISYADIFYAPGVPSLEGTLNRRLSDVLYCIKNGLSLSTIWEPVEG